MTYIYSSFYCAVCSSDTAGKKTRFQDIKVYFCLKNAKKKERGQPGLTLDNIEKPLIHFASPRPRKPLNCLLKLSPSLETIEVFGKPPPVPFPCDRMGTGKGTPSFNVPFRLDQFRMKRNILANTDPPSPAS